MIVSMIESFSKRRFASNEGSKSQTSQDQEALQAGLGPLSQKYVDGNTR